MKKLSTEEALKRCDENGRNAAEMLAILRQRNPGYDEATRALWMQFQEGMDVIVFDDDLEVIYWIEMLVERFIGERRLDCVKSQLMQALEWCDSHRTDIPFEQVREKFQTALEICERRMRGTSSGESPMASE